tara:strand:- start:124 stop:417 length:294 start_codon:yes stop_codon:yes gene_type:complete
LVKSEIIKKLKAKYPNLSQLQLQSILDIIFDTIANNLVNNKDAEIKLLGNFSIKKIKEKKHARNPKTGEKIYIPAKKKIAFKMSKHLKGEINQQYEK